MAGRDRRLVATDIVRDVVGVLPPCVGGGVLVVVGVVGVAVVVVVVWVVFVVVVEMVL